MCKRTLKHTLTATKRLLFQHSIFNLILASDTYRRSRLGKIVINILPNFVLIHRAFFLFLSDQKHFQLSMIVSAGFTPFFSTLSPLSPFNSSDGSVTGVFFLQLKHLHKIQHLFGTWFQRSALLKLIYKIIIDGRYKNIISAGRVSPAERKKNAPAKTVAVFW